MSAQPDAVLASIELQGFDQQRGCYNCGCEIYEHSGRSRLCSYHEGFVDGFDAGSSVTLEPDK